VESGYHLLPRKFMNYNEELTNGIQLNVVRVMYNKQLQECYGVPLGACAFGCKISKSKNVLKITMNVKINFMAEVH
jgi:hypothetical protein